MNSKGTRYKVVDIIEAQDDKIANSIFKERAKKKMSGIRNITKVVVEDYKEGDEPLIEEIVVDLPKVEEPEIKEIDKKITKKEFFDFADAIFDNRNLIMKNTLEKLLNSDKIILLKVSLKDKFKDETLLTAYKLLWVPKLNAAAKGVDYVDSYLDLSKESQNSLFSAMVKTELPFITDMYDSTIHNILIYQLKWTDNGYSNKDISNILNTIEGENRTVQEYVYNTTREVIQDLGYNIDEMFKFQVWNNK